MKRLISFFLTAVIAAVSVAVPCYAAAEGKQALLFDAFDHLTDAQEENVLEKANILSAHTGFNIILIISDDIGTPKTDSHVVAYADDAYDELCGINTDGVLLLINNDTKYDYISTSGSAINYLSDSRIDNILENITPDLKKEDYEKALVSAMAQIMVYYDSGKANHQTEVFGHEVDLEDFFGFMFVFGFIGIIVAIIVYFVNASQFKLSKPQTSVYMVPNSLYLAQKTDTFVGVVTNRTYSPRSSGSSGGGGGGHHSSTHHSSGGGRHGGGGHHR